MNSDAYRSVRRVLVALVFSTGALTSQPVLTGQATVDLSALHQVAADELKAGNIPGAAVAVIQGDRVIFAKGFGVASIETGTPVTPDTLFQIGSMTKTFTAAAVLTLAEEGTLKIDRPIADYVKGLSPKLSKVSTAQLLSHTAGLKDEPDEFGLHDESALSTYLKSWTDDYCLLEPGQVFSYSNSGFALAGLVMQEVGQKPFATQMTERILQPLGMARTTFRPTEAMTYPLAVGHQVKEGKPTVVRPLADDARLWPAGTMYSSVNELARFAIAFLNEGRFEGRQILQPSVITQMSTPHASVPSFVSPPAEYGYGLFMNARNRGVRQIWHDGTMTGYLAAMRLVPEHHVAVIALSNSDSQPLSETITRALELMVPLEPRTTRVAAPTVAMADAEMQGYTGSYVQPNRWTCDVAIRDGKLWLKQFGREFELHKVGDDRFEFQPPGAPQPQTIVIKPPAASQAGYLHQYVWAFRRMDVAK